MTLTFGSLFAGVGGFDMGFEQAGWDCKFQVEWDKNCKQILNKHWPDVPKWGDVSDVSGAEIPPVDCIIFGSPCQDLSVAGKRAGLEGERSGLFRNQWNFSPMDSLGERRWSFVLKQRTRFWDSRQ